MSYDTKTMKKGNWIGITFENFLYVIEHTEWESKNSDRLIGLVYVD